jgi:anti-sigma regulatory factor (Ser/Thr protein kinase)
VYAESGRGLALINALVDELSYERENEHNLWKIMRRISN